LFFALSAPVDLSPLEVEAGELGAWVFDEAVTGRQEAPRPSGGGAR
jgi:hypothetical protein